VGQYHCYKEIKFRLPVLHFHPTMLSKEFHSFIYITRLAVDSKTKLILLHS
jgi:hypothetical protein